MTKQELKKEQEHIDEYTDYFDFEEIKEIKYVKLQRGDKDHNNYIEIQIILKDKRQYTGSIQELSGSGIEIYLY